MNSNSEDASAAVENPGRWLRHRPLCIVEKQHLSVDGALQDSTVARYIFEP
jgi:hypothetical protein